MSYSKVIGGEIPDRKQGKHGFWSRLLDNGRVTTCSSLNCLQYLRYQVGGEDLHISTVTLSSLSQSFQAHDPTFYHLPQARGSPGCTSLAGGSQGYPVGYEECQVQRQKRRSHLITELRRPGAGAVPWVLHREGSRAMVKGPRALFSSFFLQGGEPTSNLSFPVSEFPFLETQYSSPQSSSLWAKS